MRVGVHRLHKTLLSRKNFLISLRFPVAREEEATPAKYVTMAQGRDKNGQHILALLDSLFMTLFVSLSKYLLYLLIS